MHTLLKQTGFNANLIVIVCPLHWFGKNDFQTFLTELHVVYFSLCVKFDESNTEKGINIDN